MKSTTHHGFTILLSALGGLYSLASPAMAQLAYDGFAAGGPTPNTANGEYLTGTASTNGTNNDSLVGQGPTLTGFSGTWTSSDGSFANFVYPRVENNQLTYTDASNRQLITTPGQVNLFRDSGSSTSSKIVSRPLDIGTNLPNELYISLLTQVAENAQLNVETSSASGGTMRPFGFGIDGNGNPYVFGSEDDTPFARVTNTSVTVDPDAPHFLVAKLSNVGTTLDQIDLFLDPLLEDELLNTPVATFAGGNFFVGSNGAWTLGPLVLDNVNTDVPQFVITDEIRIGDSFASVTQNLQVPEPSSIAIWSLLVVGLFGYGVWRRLS